MRNVFVRDAVELSMSQGSDKVVRRLVSRLRTQPTPPGTGNSRPWTAGGNLCMQNYTRTEHFVARRLRNYGHRRRSYRTK